MCIVYILNKLPRYLSICIILTTLDLLNKFQSQTVPPIAAGSVKLTDWLIREAEETLENNTWYPKKGIGNRDPMQRVNYQISLYPPHKNRKIERRVKKTSGDLWSRKSGKNEGWHK